MRIATMNVQNMRLRRRGGSVHLDGARDRDLPEDRDPGATRLDPADRRLTARLLGQADADVVALQEVFDRETLDHFHDAILVPEGVQPYRHRVCLPGNDGRGLDVALMSRRPLDRVESHAALRPGDLGLGGRGADDAQPVFRRDCLEVDVAGFTLYVCHFKAPHPDAEAAWPVRRLEALAVRTLIERRFATPETARWLVVGDLNDPGAAEDGDAAATAPLRGTFGCDLLLRLAPSERWTWFQPSAGRYAVPDAMLASPALAAACPQARPRILRAGIDRKAGRYRGRRFAGVGPHRPHASDHAAVVIDLCGL